MDTNKRTKSAWRLEDQEWWIKYSQQVKSGEIESVDAEQVTASMVTGSSTAGSGSLYMRSSGSGSGSLYVRSSGSYYLRGTKPESNDTPDETQINAGVMAYGLKLI